DGGRDLGDVAHLAGQVAGHRVDVVGQVLPRAADAFDLRLPAELALGADLAGDARHLAGERVELVDHRVDRVLELEDLAAHLDGDLLGQVAASDGGRDLGDVAHLPGQVGGHRVHVVGQVFPGDGGAAPRWLAAELALGADLAGDAGHLAGECIELIDHRVDGVLELENLALDVDGDLARQVAPRDRGGHVGDVAHLSGEVGGHRIHVVGQVFPGAADPGHLSLPAELALGADLARDARHFAGEAVELVDHRVDGVLELENLALHVDRDLLRQVAAGDGGRDLGDVAHLPGQVGGHRVHVLGQVRPGSRNARHLCLAAELAFGADLARHARHLGGETVQLVDHRVDGVLELEDFALHVDGDLLGKVPQRDGS